MSGFSFVYFIAMGNWTKIGKADDVQKRMANLQSATPVELHLIASIPTQQPLQMEASLHEAALDPDGRLLMRTDQSHEAMLKAFDFWFPDPDAPDFRAAKVNPAPEQLIQLWKQLGQIPDHAPGPFWQIEVPFPKSHDGHTYVVTFQMPHAPTLDEAMWIAWSAYYKELKRFEEMKNSV
jgi:Meiotically Up-regulated Gene 113 (MUG113) protein